MLLATHTHRTPVRPHPRQAFTDPSLVLRYRPAICPLCLECGIPRPRLSASPPVGRLDLDLDAASFCDQACKGGGWCFNACRPLPKSAPVPFVKADAAGQETCVSRDDLIMAAHMDDPSATEAGEAVVVESQTMDFVTMGMFIIGMWAPHCAGNFLVSRCPLLNNQLRALPDPTSAADCMDSSSHLVASRPRS